MRISFHDAANTIEIKSVFGRAKRYESMNEREWQSYLMNLYRYIFSSGFEVESEGLKLAEIEELSKAHGILIFNGYRAHLEGITLLRANSHTRGDGFKPGWHPGLNMEIRTNGQYQAELKARGMVEIGNEKQKSTPIAKTDIGSTVVEEAKKMGVELSGREIDKITGKID
jgi:hypothetical protein